MERDNRLRVVLVAALAVGVMAGVVVSALVARRDATASQNAVPPTLAGQRDPTAGLGRRDRDHDMPEGCEVDPAAPPEIAFDLPSDVLDLGSLKQNVQVEREVRVRNVGRGVLCVRDVETGCGCVKADWTGDPHVAPGGSGLLRLRIDTTGKEGPQEKAVRVYTNDPAHAAKVAEVKVRLDVRMGIVVGQLPNSGLGGVNFGTHAPGKPATVALRLKCPKEDAPWEIRGVESAAASAERTTFQWKLVPAEPNDPIFRCYDLMLTHPGRAETGASIERVKILTTHPDRPEILLDTQLQVVTKFYPSPLAGRFGFIRKDGVPPSRTLLVMSGEATTDFVVTSAKVEGKGFVAGEPRRVKEGWAVDVRYDGMARGGGPLKATLVVAIADPELPEIRWPLEASVMGE